MTTYSWGTRVLIAGASTDTATPSIAIEGQSTKKPIVACTYGSSTGVAAARGNAEQATSFTFQGPLHSGDSVIGTPPKIIQGADGDENVIVCGNGTLQSGSNTIPIFYHHSHAANWNTWSEILLEDGGAEYSNNVTFVSRGYHKGENDINILAFDDTGVLSRLHNYNRYQNFASVAAYTHITSSDGPGATTVKARWANYYEPTLTTIDLLVESDGDIWYERIDLNISF